MSHTCCAVSAGRGGRLLTALTVTTSLAMVPSLPAFAQSASPGTMQPGVQNFDIPAQPLADALIRFGRQAGLQVSAETSLVQNLRSTPIKGAMSWQQALSSLLSGTGLNYRLNGSMVSVEKAPAAGDSAIQLAPIQIEGKRASDPTLTEGTGSYTTPAVTVGSKIPVSMRETPQTVSVVTQQQIQDQDLNTISDALQQTPGLTIQNPSTNNFVFYSRGFQLTTVQQDGVPLQYTDSQAYAPLSLAMYDHVEVLRGPSGLFTGAGQPSGTVNLVRKQPLDHFAVTGDASIGSFDFYRTTGDVTGPLNSAGTLRGRLVGSFQDNNYYYDTGHNRDGLLYGTFEADLDPDTILRFGTSYQNNNAVPTTGLPAYSNGQLLDVPRSTFLGVDWGHRSSETINPFIDLTHTFDNGWKFHAAADYFHQDTDWLRVTASSAVNPSTNTISAVYGTHTHYLVNQGSLDSSLSGPIDVFGRTHQLIAGFSWQNEDYIYSPGAAVTIPGPFNVFNLPSSIPEPSNFPPKSKTDANTTQYGLYASARISLADPLTLILGGRLHWYNATSQALYPTVQAPTNYGNDGVFTPYAALVYDFTKQLSAYASYTTIFQPQSFLTYSGALLNPVDGKQYEAGVKGAFLDDQLDASLAFFLVDENNTAQADATHPGFYLPSGGEIESKGIDVQITGRIIPGWNITAGYTYNPTKYIKDATYQGQPYSTFAPVNIFKLWTNYEFRGGPLKDWSLGGGAYAVSNFSSSGITQGAYATFSARVGYKINDHVTASLNLNNITDTKYYQTVGAPQYNNIYGAPFNAIFTVRASF